MRTIWKFPLEVQQEQLVAMPRDARLLCVRAQHNSPHIWVLVDDAAPLEYRRILTRGTGHDATAIEDPYRHVGTYFLRGGDLVYHVFAE